MAPLSLSSTASDASGPVAEHPPSITDDVFSDESDFHGSLKTKATYRQLAAAYDPEKYWAVHEWNTQVAAARGRKARHEAAARQRAKLALRKQQDAAQQQMQGETRVAFDGDGDTEMKVDATATASASPKKPDSEDEKSEDRSRKPQNYYEGVAGAKQLSESVADFLARLPPSTTTPAAAGGPWIWIANPYPARGTRSPGQARHTGSDPEFGDGDVATFRQLGTRLLEGYLSRRHGLEAQSPAKAPGTITRMLRPDRLKLESDIKALAKAQRVTAGKWMLFPREDEVDTVWAAVAHAVWDGKLGTAAKVATATGEGGDPTTDGGDDGRGGRDRGVRLICIYTPDFSDHAGVTRVLQGLKDLGLLAVDAPPRRGTTSPAGPPLRTVYYKCDAYTHLDLSSGNEYKLRASMYSSRDLFPEWYPGGGSMTTGHRYQ